MLTDFFNYIKKQKTDMKKMFLLITALLLTIFSFGQSTTFTAGWYIVEKGATYTDYDLIELASGKDATDVEGVAFVLKAGEAVFATELSGDVYYCFDPSGTPILIKGKTALTKAPTGFGVGIIVAEIQLLSGESLTAGMYVWIIGQDIAKQTIKIQINNGEVLEIPETKIALLTALIKKNSKASWFRETE
jgi:hypothetical protein